MLNSLKLSEINPSQINLTGVRLLVLFSLLVESPRTVEEINEYFEQNNYPKDTFSIDTLRNDINALKFAGCTISRADKSNNYKYTLLSHPFNLQIDKNTAENIHKIYNRSYNFLTIEQLLSIEKLLNILSTYTENDEVSEYLRGISILKRLDKNLIKDLIYACKNKYPMEFDYKAPNTGLQHYEAIPKNFLIRSKKLYLNMYIKTYERNSYLPVHNIIAPITIKLTKDENNKNTVWVIYELKGIAARNFVEQDNEKIIEKRGEILLVKYTTDTYFQITQKILSYGPNCKAIEPDFVVDFNINKLKEMYEEYKNG